MRRAGLLLVKDLRVLGRARPLLVLLVVYPVLIALLVGLVVRFAADRPPVALVDLDGLPSILEVSGEEFDLQGALDSVDDDVQLIPMSEGEAERRLEAGEVLAVIVVPDGFSRRIRGMSQAPTLVLKLAPGGFSSEIQRRVEALVFDLNRELSETFIQTNLELLDLLIEGGTGVFGGNEFTVIGFEETILRLEEVERQSDDPEIRQTAAELQDFIEQATFAVTVTEGPLRATANPIELETDSGLGRTLLLSAQVQSYAIALTLVFLCVLLSAAAIASERDEGVIGRLARGLVHLRELIAEKTALSAVVAVVLGLALVSVFGIAVEIADSGGGQAWDRIPLLAIALVLAGFGFGALGVLIGVLAREGRTAALVAFLVVLPIVLVGLIPKGSSGIAAWVSTFFPFTHAVSLFQATLFELSPWGGFAREAAWLVGLTLVFWAISRIGVRRLLP